MAPENVRTVPPWVIQRPPQSLHPQHNHAPSEPRHMRDVPDASLGDADNENNENSGTIPDSNASEVVGVPIDVDGAADTLATEENLERGLSYRLSHLFQRKEGRKWDHLRSAEPVIVPQFHVVTTPKAFERDDADYIGSQCQPVQTRQLDDELRRKAGVGSDTSQLTPTVSPRDGGGVGPSSSTAAAGSSSATARNASTSKRASSSDGLHRSSTARSRHPWWYNPETQWRGFIESSRYPHLPNEKSEIIDDEEMARLNPDFGYNTILRPKAGGGEGGGGVGHIHHKYHRPTYLSDKAFYQRIWQLLLHHPLGPLACRLTVLMTSIVALAVAITIFRRERLGSLGGLGDGDRSSDDFNSVWLADRQQERTQVIVAIVVDVVAVPYIGYITVDDYTGKPLGLRPPQARIRLILTDLFFIIFKSASTALGFEAMIFFSSEGSQGLLRALGAFELIGLISWALTLTINIFREIERLGGGK